MNGSAEKKIREIRKILVLNRAKILQLLLKRDTCVCQMVEKLNLRHNLVSHHLKTLEDMGYLTHKRNGKHMIYSLKKDKKLFVKKLMVLLAK